MTNKKIRFYIAVIMPLVTILACTFYLSAHHTLITQLAHTSPRTLVSVFLMYVLMIGMLILILDATLRICSKKIDNQESVVLNSYSLLVNFFVPGQSGPIFRGAYLKKRHSLKIKNFIAVTLLYYIFYGATGVFLLVVGSKSWKLTLLASVIMSCAITLAIYAYITFTKFKKSELNLSPTNVLYLIGATILQSVIQIAIYFVELHNGNQHVGLNQVITYTGAANLALFVALTPGAIGIRESFLFSTEKLHHISSSSIVVANVIDRSVYLIFLMALGVFLLISSVQSKNKSIFKVIPVKLKLIDKSLANEHST